MRRMDNIYDRLIDKKWENVDIIIFPTSLTRVSKIYIVCHRSEAAKALLYYWNPQIYVSREISQSFFFFFFLV